MLKVGLALAETEPRDRVPVEVLADLHAKLANALMACGNLGSAAENYKAALRLVPSLTACWCNLGSATLKLGNAQEAISFYLQALQISPGHWPSRTNLVQALTSTKQYPIARLLLVELAAERPHDAQIRRELGKVCFELKEMDQAIQHFEEALALAAKDAESLYWIGGIRQALGDLDGARQAYVRAAQIQPLIRRPAAKSPADFRVLALYAPFAANTPAEFLFRDAPYETDTLALVSSADLDRISLRDEFQVVVNLLSDADQALNLLPVAADLVKRLGKPTVNDPDRVLRTGRDATGELLSAIPGCRIPKTVRLKAGTERAGAALEAASSFSFPLLARPAGTHGGDRFDKIEDGAHLVRFLDERPDEDHYLIEYIDYRSDDGYFRKYRFIFVGEEIFPYHLAIGNDWKLHRDSTDMGDHPWMQQEEEAFLRDPAARFDERHDRAMRMIRERVGLDYFGIDCGLDARGDLVLFEVNASMLVHDQNGPFTYKDRFVHRIKAAFDAMLGRFAQA